MADSKVVLIDNGSGRATAAKPDADLAWVWVGRFATLLASVGLADFVLGWYPPGFGLIEWEFGTVASTFAGLPLVTMGMAGVLGAGLARGQRARVIVVSWILLVFAAVILGALVMFLTDIPIALQAVSGPAALGIKKAVAKTILLGVAFSGAYIAAGIGALKHVFKARH